MCNPRLLGLGLALALCLSAAPVIAQRGSNQPQRPQPDADTVALVQSVDAAIVASPAAQTADQTQGEIPLKWESAHFIKGQNGVYVPYTIAFDPAAVKTADVAVYIRAVEKSQLPTVAAALTPPAAAQGNKPAQPPAVPKYAWDNVHFLQKPADGRITRAIALPAGDYELFIALKERSAAATAPAATAAPAGAARVGLLRHPLHAPDYGKAELQTSSVILASSVEPVTGQLSPAEQEANPYVFGPMRIVPAQETKIAKANELQVIFWIYGASAASSGKPDVTVDFNFYLKQPDGSEKYFNKTAPQELNAQTLPPEFSVAAGHQLPGSLVVGLAPFPAGDYRLEIKVTDKPSGKAVTQNVTFTVTA
jgi:hypothetical protein